MSYLGFIALHLSLLFGKKSLVKVEASSLFS